MNRGFTLRLEPAEFDLSIDEIWPDGNAPENPTAADVVAQMHGTVDGIMSEWNITPDFIEVVASDGSNSARYR